MITQDSKRETNFAVNLTPCPLKAHTYVARVPRKTLTTDQMLDLVAEHNQGIDRYQVGHAMELLKKEILEQASLGFAVDMMGVCKLYVAPLSSVTSLTPEAETVTGFEARFSASDELKAKLKGASATVTNVVDSLPQISVIEDPGNGNKDGKLRATFSARLTGKKLKLGGKSSGVYFVPADDSGKAEGDEKKWTRVEDGFITKNTAKTLEFHLPRTLEAEKQYYIAVRTGISGGTALRHTVTGMSKILVAVTE